MAIAPFPQPTIEKCWVQEGGLPSQVFGQYMYSLDRLARALLTQNVNTQTANYTLVINDAASVIEMNLAGANTLTVPPISSVPFPIGTWLWVVQAGAGITTLTAGAGVTLRARVGFRTLAQWAVARLYKRASDEWVCSGDLQV